MNVKNNGATSGRVAGRAIHEVFPLRAIEQDCLISVHGDLTICFAVSLPEIFTLNASFEGVGEGRVEQGDYIALCNVWTKAIGVLPSYTILHKQDWFVEETYDASKSGIADRQGTFLDKASERHFNERPYLHHECYLYLTNTHPERRDVGAVMTSLTRGRLVAKEVGDKHKVEEFFNSVEQFVSILESSRLIGLQRIKATELAGTDTQAGLLERYMSLSLRDEVVTLADLEMNEELRVGGKYTKFYTISDIDDLPEWVHTNNRVEALSTERSNVSVSYAAPVSLMLNCNHIYNQYIFIEDKQAAFPKLEQRATQMRSLANFGKDNEVNAMLLNQYLSYAAETGFTPVRSHFNIQVWTEDKSRLPVLRNLVSSAIAKLGVRPRENTKDALGLFWAGIPGNAADMPGEDKYWSFVPQSVCLLNQETNYYDSVSHYGVKLVERMSGKPLLVDLSDLPMKKGWVTNRNKFILGPTGSGKSFFTNHALRSFHVQGSHAVIVDVGHSYRGLCDMLGGMYLTYSEDEPINFNPFFIEHRALPDVEKKEAIKVLLQTLWKRSDERQTMSEYTALSDAVTQYFEVYLPDNPDVFPCFNSFYEFMQTDFPRYLAEHKVQIGYFDYDNFIYVLRPFYQGGEYEELLNSAVNIDLLNVPFIVFELDNIKDHPILFPVVTIIIMDTFISKMRKLNGVRKIILIEEAWKAIMKDGMAEYIKYLYKTVRKFFGEAWIVTQEVDDIIGNKIVKDSIINNADTKILLDQRKYRNKFSHVKDLLALTDKEKDLCLSLNRDLDPRRRYKEVFISWGGQESKVYGVEVSTEEYLAYSTEQTEKLRLEEKVKAHGGNYDLALRDYADEFRAGR